MTDKQSKRDEYLTRIDELDRMKALTTDREMIEAIEERKKVLRDALEQL